MRLAPICLVFGALTSALAAAQPPDERPLWVLLSDNAGSPGPLWPTGCTYTYGKQPTNPADSTGRRLIDGDLPWADWNTCIGHNWEDLTVTFDLQAVRRLAQVRILMPMPQRPKLVDVAVRTKLEDQWREVGTIEPGKPEQAWHELTLEEPLPAREVRLTFRLKEWGFYIREVELWGLPDEGATGKATGTIVVGNQPATKSVAAAYDLKYHLQRMIGSTWSIVQRKPPAKGNCLLVGSEIAKAVGETVPQGPWPTPEEVLLKTKGRLLVVAGNDAGRYQGTAFAATLLLEKLGCGWFGPDPLWQIVPRLVELEWPKLNLRQRPGVAWRSLWYAPGPLSSRWFQGGPVLSSGHAHDAILPPAEHFQSHPEYYALIDGKRTAQGEWQLCTSNPDVIRITIEKARNWFDQSPENMAFSLSNNDCGGFCQCSECAKTGTILGARMLVYASTVQREISKTHAGRHVCFLAYWYTVGAPPAGTRAEPGVIVMMVNQACHAHALEDVNCPPNVNWCRNFEAWAATGAEMAIYEWYIPGFSSPWAKRIPWVSGDVATRNLRYWMKHGVHYVTYESQAGYEESPSKSTPGYPLRWPLFFPAARMMWDATFTAEQLLDDACRKLYGSAASPMRAYYRGLQQALEKSTAHGGIWNLPSPLSYLTPEVEATLTANLDAAAKASTGADPDIGKRIAEEGALWQRATETLTVLRKSSGAPTEVWVDGNLYLVAEKQVSEKWLRELGGIPAHLALVLRPEKGPDQPIAKDQTLELKSGMRFFSVQRR